ncbi:MAG TPA: cyclic nucleotide-binding domain-containing protein [Terriglobia bacterium]
MQVRTWYPAGTTLFVEDQLASGIFVLHTGRAKLTQSLGSRIVRPGEILGISSAIAASPHGAAARTIERSEIGFLGGKDFSSFLCEHGAVAFRLVQLLSTALTGALDQVRFALTRSPWTL